IVTACAAILERRHLGVGTSDLGVEALADYLAVADQDRADERIGTNPAAAAIGERQGPAEVDPILLCDHGGHSARS
ncbi:MAG TPA: hypothetical protein VE777_01540, partial [Gaiellales bacterium]|nr:hypothetical protein [Gaiellales bacterium]